MLIQSQAYYTESGRRVARSTRDERRLIVAAYLNDNITRKQARLFLRSIEPRTLVTIH